MMKVGLLTVSLPMETREALRTAKRLGAHGVQLWIVDNDLDPQTLTRSGRLELMSYMGYLGLEPAALCGDLGGFAEAATVDERIARTKGMFDLCVELQTPILTTHIGAVPKDKNSRQYRQLREAVRELAEYAAKRDCFLAAETGPESAEALEGFLRSVASDGAKVNYDPANLCMAGFDHLNGVLALRDFIVHTHAKDGMYNSANEGGHKETPLGKGDVNFPEYLSLLREIDYEGYLTVERESGENPVADVAEAIRFLKTQEGVEP